LDLGRADDLQDLLAHQLLPGQQRVAQSLENVAIGPDEALSHRALASSSSASTARRPVSSARTLATVLPAAAASPLPGGGHVGQGVAQHLALAKGSEGIQWTRSVVVSGES